MPLLPTNLMFVSRVERNKNFKEDFSFFSNIFHI